MITINGQSINSNLTEAGRSVFTVITEEGISVFSDVPSVVITGELAEEQNTHILLTSAELFISGSVEATIDTILTLTDSISDHLNFNQTSSYSFSGDLLYNPVGSSVSTLNTTISFNGIVGVTGAIAESQRSTTSISGILGVAGIFQITSGTTTQFISVAGVTGEFSSSQYTEFTFKSDLITGNLNSQIESIVALSGFPLVSGSLTTNILSEIIFNGIVTGLSTAIGDLTSNIPTICMNTKTIGVSEYTGYNFNSFFKIGQDYYGCCSAGVFKLAGDLDNTIVINAAIVRSAISPFDEQQLKSVRDCYVYLRSSNDTSIRLITNEQVDRDGYPINYDGVDGMHRRRVKVAQGIKGTTWQVEFKNEYGADFTLKQVDVIPTTLTRSI